ncbi:hypothetical protein Syun_005331 [Stephania yunnanensis]|uniref:Small auxin up regulated protein n=1 Tax=Stephania yunnanensis TaxID=152371 RepID=A0AAP0L8P8_9MAGN
MAIRMSSMVSQVKQIRKLRKQLVGAENSVDVPKGHLAIYVGEAEKKRFIVPVSFLNHPSFQDLLRQAEEEFGFNHPMGGLTIPCQVSAFIDLTSRLNVLDSFSLSRFMGIHLPSMAIQVKQIFKLHSLLGRNLSVPKGHLAVYVGETEKKRFVVPLSFLNHPAFQDLLHLVEEELGSTIQWAV